MTLWIVAWHRPRLWAWAVMLALFAMFPINWLSWISGTTHDLGRSLRQRLASPLAMAGRSSS